MPITKDLSALPQVPLTNNQPTSSPFLADILAQAWYARYIERRGEGYAPAIPELPYRASSAGFRCDRQLYATLNKVTPSDPFGVADAWRMELGSMVHADLQSLLDELVKVDSSWKSEVVVDLRPIGISGSAHADLVWYTEVGGVLTPDTVVEVKTINGFGFKRSATNFKGAADGPRSGHILQGAMPAAALGAKRLVILYISLENVSPALAAAYSASEVGRFMAEWAYNVADLQPMIQREAARIARVTRYGPDDPVPSAEIHDTEYPLGATIMNASGRWELREGDKLISAGKTWYCDYCDWRSWCKSQPESVPVMVTL